MTRQLVMSGTEHEEAMKAINGIIKIASQSFPRTLNEAEKCLEEIKKLAYKLHKTVECHCDHDRWLG